MQGKYLGEDTHKLALQNQHKAFTLVHRRVKATKKKQAMHANKNAKLVDYKVGMRCTTDVTSVAANYKGSGNPIIES